eukprot:COSAG01_NODE_29255_length_641_cov_2.333948_1_plen_112_part_00
MRSVDKHPVVPRGRVQAHAQHIPGICCCQQQPAHSDRRALSSGGGYTPQGGRIDLAATAALTAAEMQCEAAGERSVGRQLPLRSRVAQQGGEGGVGSERLAAASSFPKALL